MSGQQRQDRLCFFRSFGRIGRRGLSATRINSPSLRAGGRERSLGSRARRVRELEIYPGLLAAHPRTRNALVKQLIGLLGWSYSPPGQHPRHVNVLIPGRPAKFS